MCELMISADPHPFAAPYPTRELLYRHSKHLQEVYYHFWECSARMMRDDAVVRYSLELLIKVIAYADKVRQYEKKNNIFYYH